MTEEGLDGMTLEAAAASLAAARIPRFVWRGYAVWLQPTNRDWTSYNIFIKIA